MITKGTVQVDIGANPSAEGEDADEGPIDSESYQVNDVVDSFRLQETSFDKKSYVTYIKGYMKELKTKIQEKDPQRLAVFEGAAQEYVKKVIANFDKYSFYTGDSMNPEGMVVLMDYRENGTTPYLIYWKDGLKAEKF